MTPGVASQTAQFVAMQRAYHHLFAPEPKLLEDNLAMALVGLPGADTVKTAMDALRDSFSALGPPEVVDPFLMQVEHSVCIRSRVAESRLHERLEHDLEQLVILGAGLDTMAYRHAAALRGIKVFEVDHPDTQELKRASLERAEINIPDNLEFVAFDFEHQTLGEALAESGIDLGLQSLITWLGVHMYLDDETVKATFEPVGKFARGSELIMDFLPRENPDLADEVEHSISELRKVVEQMGEPMKSRYNEAELQQRLMGAGFSDVTFLDTQAIVRRFLGGARDSYCMPDDAVHTLIARI